MKLFIPVIIAMMLLLHPFDDAQAVFVEDRLSDPAQEKRANELSKEFRCLVCQNQTIADSNAGLARDLRKVVRERIVAGDTNAEVRQYLVDRYGDWVLMEPPMKTGTLLLWIGPALFLIGGGIMVILMLRKRNRNAPASTAQLSDIEQQQLNALLDPEDEGKV
jgi:cytochrome c-type biogenesis protein CcmH